MKEYNKTSIQNYVNQNILEKKKFSWQHNKAHTDN